MINGEITEVKNGKIMVKPKTMLGRKIEVPIQMLYNTMSQDAKIKMMTDFISTMSSDERFAFVIQMFNKKWGWWKVVEHYLKENRENYWSLISEQYQKKYEETRNLKLINSLRYKSTDDEKGNLLETFWYWSDANEKKKELVKNYIYKNVEDCFQDIIEKWQQLPEDKQEEFYIEKIQQLHEKIKKAIRDSIPFSEEEKYKTIEDMPYSKSSYDIIEKKYKRMQKARNRQLKETEEWEKEYYKSTISPVAEIIKKVQGKPILINKEREINWKEYKLTERTIDPLFKTIEYKENEGLGKQYFLSEEETIKRYDLTPLNEDKNKETRNFIEYKGKIYEIIEQEDHFLPTVEDKHYKTHQYQKLRDSEWEKYELLDERIIFREPQKGEYFKVEHTDKANSRDYIVYIGDDYFTVHCSC